MGDFEVEALASMESTLKYHPYILWFLTVRNYLAPRQSVVGSLTGAVASQKVTEARNGRFGMLGNHAMSANA